MNNRMATVFNLSSKIFTERKDSFYSIINEIGAKLSIQIFVFDAQQCSLIFFCAQNSYSICSIVFLLLGLFFSLYKNEVRLHYKYIFFCFQFFSVDFFFFYLLEDKNHNEVIEANEFSIHSDTS